MRLPKFWPKSSSLLLFSFLLSFALPQKEVVKLRASATSLISGIQRLLSFRVSVSPLSLVETERDDLARQLQEAHSWLKKESSSERYVRGKKPIPAKIVFREPESWNTLFWIDVGANYISPHDAVIVGSSLIGLVEKVEKKRSLVRLITDPCVMPAVRVLRGGEANRELKTSLDALFETLTLRHDLFTSTQERESLLEELARLEIKLEEQNETLYLAKGQMQGSSRALWRSRSHYLKGIGFNYDTEDEYGPARELRSGKAFDQKGSLPLALIKEGDLLVTSGLDGLFPEGLHVARVVQVSPLHEGATHYEIEGVMTAGALEDIKIVYVLPGLQ